MNAFERRANLDALAIRHINLEAILAGNKRRKNQREGIHARPELASVGCYRRDDLGHALVAEQPRYRYGDLVEVTPAQLQKVWPCIVGDHSIDCRVHIVSQRQEIDLDDPQSIIVLQTGDQMFVRQIWFLKHCFTLCVWDRVLVIIQD